MNQTEYIKIVGNLSDLNKVYLSFHEGLQYSVLGPAHIPDDLDFQATSYGSHTECRVVTAQCGAVSSDGDEHDPPAYNFACNKTMAGLNMTGNFMFLGEAIESYQGGFNNLSEDSVIENANTMFQSEFGFGFGFQYFSDSAKQEQVSLNEGHGVTGLGVAGLGGVGLVGVGDGQNSSITNQYFWAIAFSLDIQPSIANATDIDNPWAGMNVVPGPLYGANGIMSCETNISEIVRLAQSPFATLFPCPSYNCLISLFQFTLTYPSLPSDL